MWSGKGFAKHSSNASRRARSMHAPVAITGGAQKTARSIGYVVPGSVLQRIRNNDPGLTTVNSIDAEFYKILEELKANITVTELELNHKITNDDAKCLRDTLRVNTTLTRIISTTDQIISEKGASYLADAMRGNPSVTRVDIGKKYGEPEQGDDPIRLCEVENWSGERYWAEHGRLLGVIKEFCVRNQKLKYEIQSIQDNHGWCNAKDLSGKSLGDHHALKIADVLRTNTNLTKIELRNNQIGDTGAHSLADALRENTAVTKIELRSNQIRDTGAHYLADALRENTVVTQMTLDDNPIKDPAVLNKIKQFCDRNLVQTQIERIRTNCVAQLELTPELGPGRLTKRISPGQSRITRSANLNESATVKGEYCCIHLGGHDVKELADALRVNTTLIDINIKKAKISADGLHTLADALRVNTTLTTVDLANNAIGDNGAYELAYALRVNTTLTKLELSTNQISDSGAECLADALRFNTKLTSIGLQDNQISNLGARYLADVLRGNTTLTEISLQRQLPSKQLSKGRSKKDTGSTHGAPVISQPVLHEIDQLCQRNQNHPACAEREREVQDGLKLGSGKEADKYRQAGNGQVDATCRLECQHSGAGLSYVSFQIVQANEHIHKAQVYGVLQSYMRRQRLSIESAVNFVVNHILSARCPHCENLISEIEWQRENVLQCIECGEHCCTWCFDIALNKVDAEYCASRCAMEFRSENDEHEIHTYCVRRHREVKLQEYLKTLSHFVKRRVMDRIADTAKEMGVCMACG